MTPDYPPNKISILHWNISCSNIKINYIYFLGHKSILVHNFIFLKTIWNKWPYLSAKLFLSCVCWQLIKCTYQEKGQEYHFLPFLESILNHVHHGGWTYFCSMSFLLGRCKKINYSRYQHKFFIFVLNYKCLKST